MGVPWKDRGARSEEHLAVLRALWSAAGDTVSFDGDYYSFPPIDPNPVPMQSIPILIGGHSGVALDRAARLGDGWIAANMGPERLRVAIAQLHNSCEDHTRATAELWLVCSTTVRADDPKDSSETVAKLHQFKMLGVADVQIRFTASSTQSLLNTLAQWGDDILPTVRK